MIFFSLKHRTSRILGRAYWKSQTASIFIANLLDYKTDPWTGKVRFRSFIRVFWETYFHEYLHLFLKIHEGKYYNSCKTIIDPLSQRLTWFMMEDENFNRFAPYFEDVIVENEQSHTP